MLNVNVIKAKSTQKVEVKPGQPTHLKVDANTRLELVDPASGKAPTQIKARRVGDNLEIVTDEKAQIEDTTVSNAQAPDLVLEDYFKQADVSLYAGTGQEAVSYVPVDGAASSSYAAMFTSATTGAALAAAPLLSPWMGVAAGAGVAAAAGGGGGGGAPVANQAPVAKDDTKSVTENGRLEGAVPNATDADGTVASYRLVGDVASGKLTFNADGSYSFDANKDFDNLAIGQTKTVNFTYSAVDNAGGVSAPKTVTITVTGTNDAPVASAATKSVDEGMKVEGSVTATDADTGATLKYALVGAAPAGLTFKDDGTYSFDASDAAYDSLKSGETKDVVVKFKANDGVVDSAEQTLTITVKGAAEIRGTITGVVTEDAATTATGSLTVSDVDAGQAKIVAQTDSAGTYGKFSITEAGVWSYSLDNSNANVQALNADQEVNETFKVKSADGTASEDVTVKITGANDAPVATFVTPIEISEDAGVHKVQLTATDVDAAAKLKFKLVDPAAFASIGIALSESGQLTVNTSNSKYQELVKDDLIDLEIKYQVEDDKGSSSLESTFRLKISGVSDTATITGESTGVVTEDATTTTTATGSLTVRDVDAGQAKVVAQTDSAGTYGKFSITEAGAWTYSLNNGNANVQALVADGKVTETFTVKSADGSASKDVVVTVKGVNDDATISGTATGDVTEDATTTTATGSLTVSDVDAGQAKVVAQTDSVGTYGKFSITEAGEWTYSLGNSNANVQALLADGKVTDTFTVKSADGTGSQDVVVTIKGVNDVPVANAAMESVDEGMKVEGSVTATDADAGATLKYALVGAAPAGLTFKDDGTYSFDASDAAYDSLKSGETKDVVVKFKANDGVVDSAEQTLTIKVKGVNDVATINGTDTGDVTEDATTTVKGSLSVSDVDTGQAKVEAQTDTAGKFGKFSITEAGEWTYELDNELVQSLRKDYFIEDKLTVKSIDGSATKDVVITINGADDRAEIKFVKDATGEDLKIVKSPELVNPEAPSAKGTLSVGMLDFNDKIIVSGIKFNSEQSSPLTGSNLTKEALEAGFLNSLVLHPITNNGGLHNLAWDFYTGGTLPADFRLVLDYTLQSVNEGEVEPVSTVVIQVDVTGVNSPVTVSLQQNDKDQVTVTETNDEVESGIQTLTVNEWDYGNKVNVKVGSAKVNLEKSTFLEASNVDASFEEYIQQWLHIGDFRDLSGVSNLDWNFKTTFKDDLDPVPEGEKMVLDYVLNFYENDSPEPVTTKTIEVTIEGKNDAPIYKPLIDEGGEDSSFAKLNVSTNSKANAKGKLSPYDPDFIETITHEIKDLEFDAVKSTPGMKEKFDALSVSLKDLLTLEVLPEFSEPHSLTWKFNAKEVDLSLASAGVEAGSVLAMNYVLHVTDFYGAFSEQKIHIELNV